MFWLKLGAAFLALFAVIVIFNLALRRLFRIEKEESEFFSYGHVNELHQKVDLAMRIGSGLILIIFSYLYIFESLSFTLFLGVMISLFVIDYSVKIVFQWRYSQNPKQVILTINEMTWLVIGVILIFQFDILNLY